MTGASHFEPRDQAVETIANPRTQVADLVGIGRLCRERGLLFVVDDTTTSPAPFRPRSVGASPVINSLIKTIAGHGDTFGLARWREQHPKVEAVHDPLLSSHAAHERAKSPSAAGSWLLGFELRDPSSLIELLSRLTLPIKATGLGDTRPLIIPVAPTIFWEAGPEARAAMGIAEGLIRVSVGLEDEADLVADFDRALG